MKFRVLKDSYLFRTYYKPGEIVDFPDDKLPRDISGNVMFNKMSCLEPIEPQPSVVKADTAPVIETLEDVETIGDDNEIDPDILILNDENLKNAVHGLDPDNNDHWTLGGLPLTEFLSELFQAKVTRKDVERVAPGFTRDGK